MMPESDLALDAIWRIEAPKLIAGLTRIVRDRFDTVFFASHYALFVSVLQLAIGVLLLVNCSVPVALIMLAAFVYNSFAFHATMAPSRSGRRSSSSRSPCRPRCAIAPRSNAC